MWLVQHKVREEPRRTYKHLKASLIFASDNVYEAFISGTLKHDGVHGRTVKISLTSWKATGKTLPGWMRSKLSFLFSIKCVRFIIILCVKH